MEELIIVKTWRREALRREWKYWSLCEVAMTRCVDKMSSTELGLLQCPLKMKFDIDKM